MSSPILLHINGADIESSDKSTFPIYNPLSSKHVSDCSSSTPEDWSNALSAASEAFPSWSSTTPSQRRLIFLRAADILESYIDRAHELMKDEVACTPGWVRINIAAAVGQLREVAGLATHIKGEIVPADRPETMIMVLREACGVVFAVAPWNAPVTLTVRSVATPLMCGNTVVLKPSEYSPGTQRLVVEALTAAGIPKGVLNYIPVSTERAAAATEFFVSATEVRRVNFTGSTRVGKIIARLAAEHLKQCVLELGGKAPAIVRRDADIPAAVAAIIMGGFGNAGQVCMATERVLVHEEIIDEFRKVLVEECKKLRFGSEDSQYGALQTGAAAKKVVELVSSAQGAGAELILGNGTIDKQSLLSPHILTSVTPDMAIWNVESFGPVLTLTPFATDDEAIRMANNSDYSLCGSVFTADTHAGIQMCRKLRCGATHVNGPTVYIEATLPNGGVGGSSGYGRFGGVAGIEEFTDKRIVTVARPGTMFRLV